MNGFNNDSELYSSLKSLVFYIDLNICFASNLYQLGLVNIEHHQSLQNFFSH